jgi:hypothetical protein
LDTPNHALRSNDLLASSLHFWWVALLRSSKDFWWICQQNGKCHDERLIKIWEDFGDLYQYNSFPEWWIKKGTKLFDSPQIEIELVKALTAGLQLLLKTDLKIPMPGMVCLAIPTHLDPKTISDAIFKLFTNARLRGEHYDQDAKYQIIKSGNKKAYKSIKPAYLSNALKVCVDYSAEADPINRWGTYQVSKFLGLCPQHHPKAGDSIIKTKSKQKAMRTKSSQAYSMAAKLIANVEIGRFPSCTDVPMQARWTSSQEADLKTAISCGQWQKSSWFESEHSFMLPEHLVSDTSFDSLNQPRCLDLLSDMRSVSHAG